MLFFAVLKVKVVNQIPETKQCVVLHLKAFSLVRVLAIVVVKVHTAESSELRWH